MRDRRDPFPHRQTVAWLVTLAVAATLRLAWLTARPPHHDEGVNGFLVERMLLGGGYYPYDPHNFHGPLLFYLLYVARRALGFGVWALRVPIACVGVGAALAPAALRRTHAPVALAAAALLATSPTLVYFARDAIHETLLVATMLAWLIAADRWTRCAADAPLVPVAVTLAAMFAIKETALLVVAAWLPVAAVDLSVWPVAWPRPSLLCRRLVVAIVSAGGVWLVAFTGGFRHPLGIAAALGRSASAYGAWATRAVGEAEHVHGLAYHVALLCRYEPLIAALALPGIIVGRGSRLVRVAGGTALVLLSCYSLLPYKTPWLICDVVALLAFPAAATLARLRELRPGRLAWLLLVVPLASAARLSFAHAADPREPLVYAQTCDGNREWIDWLRAARAGGEAPTLRVRAVVHDDWPLPYLLKPFAHVRWGALRPREDADVVFSDANEVAALEAALAGPYRKRLYTLRPGVSLAVYWRVGAGGPPPPPSAR